MKKNRIWIVLAGCMIMYGINMGLLFNCTGVLITSIINTENFTSSSMSGFFTLRGLITAIAMLFTAKLYLKWDIRVIVISFGMLNALAFFLMYFYHTPGQWMISGILYGIGNSLATLIPMSVIRAWFVKRRGLFMGVVTMLSGVIGALFTPVITKVIEANGWRVTSLILSGVSIAMLTVSAFMIVKKPEDCGCLPYGADENHTPPAASANKEKRKTPWRVSSYVFLFFCSVGTTCALQFIPYISQFSSSLNYPLMVGAVMTSVIMVGNTSTKLLFGFISDSIGVWKSMMIFSTLIGIGNLLLALGNGSPVLLYTGSLLLGLCYMSGVSLSLGCSDLFSSEEFEIQYSRVSMIVALFSSSVPSVLSTIYDKTQSFLPALFLLSGLSAISVLTVAFGRKFILRSK